MNTLTLLAASSLLHLAAAQSNLGTSPGIGAGSSTGNTAAPTTPMTGTGTIVQRPPGAGRPVTQPPLTKPTVPPENGALTREPGIGTLSGTQKNCSCPCPCDNTVNPTPP